MHRFRGENHTAEDYFADASVCPRVSQDPVVRFNQKSFESFTSLRFLPECLSTLDTGKKGIFAISASFDCETRKSSFLGYMRWARLI